MLVTIHKLISLITEICKYSCKLTNLLLQVALITLYLLLEVADTLYLIPVFIILSIESRIRWLIKSTMVQQTSYIFKLKNFSK